ncbi:hypothetical protein DITRI_Ditri17bG0081000 [Diplodiscus trichospermus]
MRMEPLCLEDFKDTSFDPNWSRFDYLLEVARVGQEKLQKQNLIIRNCDHKKRFEFGYLKHFLYSAPQPEAISKEESTSFKKGKSLNKNGGLKRKRKLVQEDEGREGMKLKKRSKKERAVEAGPNPPPDLPENYKQHIVEKMGGSDWVLVIQKQIFFSDVNPAASRFSMPFLHLKTHEFLSKTEVKDLEDNKAFKVCLLLEPSMKETQLKFKRWNMKTSSNYVLNDGWNSVVRNNGLEINDIVQLWSFRVESALHFALVKVQTFNDGN